MTQPVETKLIELDLLHFDRQNPRLAEYGVTPQMSDDALLRILWDSMDVKELVQSIAASGYFKHEPLIVAIEKKKYVVIEGNRRLAAVRVLVDGEIAEHNEWEIPKISRKERDALRKLPVIIASREDSWRYLGFKHVNGPAKWSSYAKAKYIADIHRNYGFSLVDISDQIGDGHKTVQRLFRGLMVLEQAEKMGAYDPEDRSRTRLSFSHLYTGLDYPGISTFINLKPLDTETENPVPKNKMAELGELLRWIYGSRREKLPPVVSVQNPHLRQLDAVLRSREAVAALRAGNDLDKAFEISLPTTEVFEKALLAAKRDLSTAMAYISAGYDKSESLLRIAGSIADMAEDLYRQMENKKNPIQRKRLTED